jgi:hypothetical protein
MWCGQSQPSIQAVRAMETLASTPATRNTVKGLFKVRLMKFGIRRPAMALAMFFGLAAAPVLAGPIMHCPAGCSVVIEQVSGGSYISCVCG